MTPSTPTAPALTDFPELAAHAEMYAYARDRIKQLDPIRKEINTALVHAARGNRLAALGPGATMKLRHTHPTIRRRPSVTQLRSRYPNLADRYLTPSRVVVVQNLPTDLPAAPEVPTRAADRLAALEALRAELGDLRTLQQEARDALLTFSDETKVLTFAGGVKVGFRNGSPILDAETLRAEHPEAYDAILTETQVAGYYTALRATPEDIAAAEAFDGE